MKNKKLSLFLLAFALVTLIFSVTVISANAAESEVWDGTIASGFARGTGTQSDPYVIETAEQLAYLASSTNSGTTYEGQYIKLANDIVLNDTSTENWTSTAIQWTAIGKSYDYSFRGNFDGDGHEVKGIYINNSSDYQGLFGCAKNATISNVGVVDSYIKGDTRVGGVVGYNRNGTVSTCYNTGAVSGTSCVGGVVGYNYAYSSSTATVYSCYNTGTVSGTNYVGGVVGENDANDGTTTVTSCYNTGTVSGKSNVGGVVGSHYRGTVSNCYYLDTCVTSGNSYGTSLTISKMQSESSYVGFDFTDTWELGERCWYDYPILKNNSHIGINNEHTYDNDCDTSCNVCAYIRTASHTVVKMKYKTDSNSHWFECLCGKKKYSISSHVYDNDCDASCNVCSYARTAPHTLNYHYDTSTHWQECICGENKTEAVAHIYDHSCDTTCNVCDYARAQTHTVDISSRKYDTESHWFSCPCGEKKTTTESHSYTDVCDKTCNKCAYEREVPHDLEISAWKHNENSHWIECLCGEVKTTVAPHTYDNDLDTSCNECGYEREIAPTFIKGDVDGNGKVETDDAIYLLRHTLLPAEYPVNQGCDFDGDGAVGTDDAIYLLRHTLLPSEYPLN